MLWTGLDSLTDGSVKWQIVVISVMNIWIQ